MSELVEKMKVALADSFAFYLKAHFYHWNVTGSDFLQYHDLFGKVYNEVYDSLDDFAEQIRMLDAFAPGGLQRFSQLTTVKESNDIPDNLTMAKNLLEENEKVLASVTEAYLLAEEEAYGLANFLQDRIAAHEKHRWFLKSATA